MSREPLPVGGLAYRAEIDGLRAVAVWAVLLFHVGMPQLSGGYVGVDVFFVISGYLITRLIQRDIERGSFSFKRFYLRRLRRLTPALSIVLVATTIGAWKLLFPEDLYSFASSLALQPVSLQNFFFLADGEYFRGAESKPLLHTWSLAVEEQFYLFWPLLLTLLARVSAKRRALYLSLGMVASLGLSLVLMRVSPKASFFMLLPRAWELGAGAVVALLEERGAFAKVGPSLRAAASAVGLALIGAAACVFTDATPFPGVAALLPVGGAALCIAATSGGVHPLSAVLANRVAVHVGLISYPLYLWHWPILVLWRYGHPERHAWPHAVGILLASVILAEATYWLIEKPVRDRAVLAGDRVAVRAALVLGTVVVAAGSHGRFSEGAAYRFSGVGRALLTAPFRAQTDRCGLAFRILNPLGQVCQLNDSTRSKRVLVWGNSHADMWSGLLRELASESGAALFLNARNCRPTVDNTFCGRHVQRAILDFAAAESITDALLISSWYGKYRVSDDVLERELERVVANLSQRSIRVWLVVDIPSGDALDPIATFQRSPEQPAFGSVSAQEESARRQRERSFFQRLQQQHAGVRILDPSSQLCDAAHCWGGKGVVAWYRDGDHLTDAGAALARSEFMPVFAD